jgi:DNA-directed RNA polymerase specialized sigma24 family protein
MSTAASTNRPAHHAYLVVVHRAGIAAAAVPETPRNRITRRRAIRDGQQALDELMRDLDALLQFFVNQYSRNPHDREDLLQLARLHVLKALPSWQPGAGSSVSTWVVNYLRKPLRNEARRLRPFYEELSEFLPGSGECARATTSDGDIALVDEGNSLVTALRHHRERLAIDDRDMLDAVLAGGKNPGGSMGNRSRVRALTAHPASGVLLHSTHDLPVPRPFTPIDVDVDAVALSSGSFPQPGWQVRAACSGEDVMQFFPERGDAYRPEVIALCAGCPVRLDCLSAGIEASTWPGLWGGHSSRTRRIIRGRVRNTDGALANSGV